MLSNVPLRSQMVNNTEVWGSKGWTDCCCPETLPYKWHPCPHGRRSVSLKCYFWSPSKLCFSLSIISPSRSVWVCTVTVAPTCSYERPFEQTWNQAFWHLAPPLVLQISMGKCFGYVKAESSSYLMFSYNHATLNTSCIRAAPVNISHPIGLKPTHLAIWNHLCCIIVSVQIYSRGHDRNSKGKVILYQDCSTEEGKMIEEEEAK